MTNNKPDGLGKQCLILYVVCALIDHFVSL